MELLDERVGRGTASPKIACDSWACTHRSCQAQCSTRPQQCRCRQVLEQIKLSTTGKDRLTDVKPNKDVPVALAIVESVKSWMMEIKSDLKRDSPMSSTPLPKASIRL